MLDLKRYEAIYKLSGFISMVTMPMLRIYSRMTHVQRARVIVRNERDEVLLVYSWIGPQKWDLPGGGVKKTEGPKIAARRELFEETGLLLPLSTFRYVTTLTDIYTAPIFSTTIDHKKPIRNKWEIARLEWFPLSLLPDNLSSLARQAIRELPKQ